MRAFNIFYLKLFLLLCAHTAGHIANGRTSTESSSGETGFEWQLYLQRGSIPLAIFLIFMLVLMPTIENILLKLLSFLIYFVAISLFNFVGREFCEEVTSLSSRGFTPVGTGPAHERYFLSRPYVEQKQTACASKSAGRN